MLEPCYDSYVPAIVLSGGVPVVVPLRYPDYSVDWDAVRAAITPRTRLLLINTPHNPTGAVLSAADLRTLADIVDGTDVIVLGDEVYQHIIFDGLTHESLARHDALAARSIVVGSFGKTYHATGWKVGYAAAPAALTAELRKVHQFVTFSTSTPMQHAIAEFLGDGARPGRDQPVLPGQAGSVPGADGGIAIPAAALARQLLPADGLLGDLGRSGRGLRDPPDAGARRRRDPDVAVPDALGSAAGAAVLFREEGRDADGRGGADSKAV